MYYIFVVKYIVFFVLLAEDEIFNYFKYVHGKVCLQ